MSTATTPSTRPLSTLHFEPRTAKPERSRDAVAHWRRTATLPTADIERLEVAASMAEVRVYVVSAAATIEVVCEYVSPAVPNESSAPEFQCDFSVEANVARLAAGLPASDGVGWLRLYVTVPSTVPLRLCEVPDA